MLRGNFFPLKLRNVQGNLKLLNFAKKKLRSIALSKDKFSCNALSIITDNERKMEKMNKLLKEEEHDLLVYGCCAHWMNLLGSQITLPEIMKLVVEVQNFFHNHHLPSA